jgi:hypothetical protein
VAGTILVIFYDHPFDLQNLAQKFAPTGYVSPPDPVRIGRYTFYKYGPGGGGVSYPDQYFLDLQDKTLEIYFNGPYDGKNKSPSPETQKLEPIMLATFQSQIAEALEAAHQKGSDPPGPEDSKCVGDT